ncbi:MAG: bile acid:sodium symporter family protein, partial [Kiritimatiellae bacterium]|nr:bile acid:sodium symporter family protein [Kiritimatiellia bacterium]
LVGACPGGTASNVMAYLAGGDVALSVTMTACSTLLSPLATPALVLLLADKTVGVDAAAMLLSIVKVVLAPVLAGVAFNEVFGAAASRVRRAMPAFSAVVVAVIVAGVVAAAAGRIREAAGAVAAAVVLHNALGMLLGWAVAKAAGMDAARRRTLAIEVGMQNSGLAVSLAATHFASAPLAALPGALFSVWHNLGGALFANLCTRRRK